LSDLPAARASFERAVAFLKGGDAAMAGELCRAALEEHPEEPNLLAVLAATLIQVERIGEAIETARRATDSDPEHAKAHEQLGIALLADAQVERAIAALERALKLDPTLDRARLSLSRGLLAAGREREAQQVFDQFVARNPQRRQLATAAEHQRSGRAQQAEAGYREILRRDPANVPALRMLGKLALEHEHYREAVVLLKRAVELAPEFRPAWLDLGQAQTESYDIDGACESYRRAIALDAGRADAHIGLGNALSRSHATAEAIEAYRRASVLNPGQASVYLGALLEPVESEDMAL
jgi:superkiller protein 3